MNPFSAVVAIPFRTIRFFVLAACLLAPVVALTGTDSAGDAECVTYRGAWFEVCHPVAFKVAPSLPSSTAEGYDSVLFVAPDDSVSFYVYAPQWGGQATDIAIDTEREEMVEQTERTSPTGEIRWFTIAARDGSYRRSYREVVEQQGTVNRTLGIRYRDANALERYSKAYERFRGSLEQYAD